MSKLLKMFAVFLLAIASGMNAFAADAATVRGTVVDPSGKTIANARVVLTNAATQNVLTSLTAQDGSYDISVLNPGTYTLIVAEPGFKSFSQTLRLQPNQVVEVNARLAIESMSESVTVTAGGVTGSTLQPTQEQVFESDQSIRVLDRKQMDIAGPVAGAAQIIALTPGANVTGYGNTGATKYTVGVNGVSQGWGGYGGYSGGGALAITFDGIPVVDPATNLWQSPTIPETFMIQNTNVTYGPGDPTDRWYNNVGGAIEFTPVQPTSKPHADISGNYGSYNQKDISVNLNSGLYRGWSTVLAGGVGSGNNFRNAPDGFQNPSKDVAILSKTAKSYKDNSFELGGYYAHGAGYRSQVIPVAANPLVTMDGQPGSKQYSQQSSGYYSTLPYLSYNKYDTNEMGLVYGRENVKLDDSTMLQNQSWFMHIARLHYRLNDVYSLGPQQDEWNSPYTDTVGDRLLVTRRLPHNTINVGGYFIHALYNSRNNFYNPADGGAKRVANIGGKVRSSYFNQSDFAISAQDDIRFNSIITITPGIRYVGFATGYYSASAQDFSLAPGAILSSHCAASQTSYNPNDPTQNPNNPLGNTITVKDQGSNCGGNESRSGVEPSVNGTVRATPWLQLYGGYMEALRAPQMGGGGGLSQSVDPASYHLSRQSYYQFGFKVLSEGTGPLNSMLLGAAFYHQNWANQEIDTTLANGNAISANGTSVYHGVNAYIDDDPIVKLHVFANLNVETATYSNYTTLLPVEATATSPSIPQQQFNGLYVPYVPTSTINAGAYYDIKPKQGIDIQPTASFEFIGRQHIFDNNATDANGNPFPRPSSQTMASYGTVNLGVKVPYRFMEFNVTALNVLNRRYNIYQFISSGGYFGTAGNGTAAEGSGYQLAYPGSPASVYGGVVAHF